MRPKVSHELVLSHGNGKDRIYVQPVGSRGDKLVIITKGANHLEVRLTGDEWRAWKELR